MKPSHWYVKHMRETARCYGCVHKFRPMWRGFFRCLTHKSFLWFTPPLQSRMTQYMNGSFKRLLNSRVCAGHELSVFLNLFQHFKSEGIRIHIAHNTTHLSGNVIKTTDAWHGAAAHQLASGISTLTVVPQWVERHSNKWKNTDVTR